MVCFHASYHAVQLSRLLAGGQRRPVWHLPVALFQKGAAFKWPISFRRIQRRMLFASSTLEAQITEMGDRLQRIELEHGQLLARIEGDAALGRVLAGAVEAAQTGSVIGAALEDFASAMRRPFKRGRAGGLASAALASRIGKRWPDGRFMGHSDWEQVEREAKAADYMRHAAGSFARAGTSVRARIGTFLPLSRGWQR